MTKEKHFQLPPQFEKSMTGDNHHPSIAGDLQSRSSCYLHSSSESDYSAFAAAASVAADTAAAVVAGADGSTARNADCTTYAVASPSLDTAQPSIAAGTAASPPIAGAEFAAAVEFAVAAVVAADSHPRRSFLPLPKLTPPENSSFRESWETWSEKPGLEREREILLSRLVGELKGSMWDLGWIQRVALYLTMLNRSRRWLARLDRDRRLGEHATGGSSGYSGTQSGPAIFRSTVGFES